MRQALFFPGVVTAATVASLSGPVLLGCEPAQTGGGLLVSWQPVAGADYYELQISSDEQEEAFGVYATGRTSTVVSDALPNTNYVLKVRAHSASAKSLGWGTWGPFGASQSCRSPSTLTPPALSPPQTKRTFPLEVMRQSEWTYDVDYLMNHNAGTITGDACFISSSTPNITAPNFMNVSFNLSTYTLYCVDVLKVHVPNTTTTGGVDKYADYLSCDTKKKDNPVCLCQNWIDRVIASQNPNRSCFTANHSACRSETWHRDCSCSCPNESLQWSAKYTGMMPAHMKSPENLGNWFSFPMATECKEDEEVGAPRPDGSRCTWRRRPMMRRTRGFLLLKNGFNATQPNYHEPRANPKQVRMNAKVFRSSFATPQLGQWTCEDGSPEAIVV